MADRDRSMDFQGFLNNLQDWDRSFKDKDPKSKGGALGGKKPNSGKVDEDRGPPKKVPATDIKRKANLISEVPLRGLDERNSYLRYSSSASKMFSNILDEEEVPDAASEKEMGNEKFKQKKFLEAIDCYSRSIALSPTAVAYANRAMAYLKVKRYEEAENDCSEALFLDDRYVKAYSRRATARKELGKLTASMEDCEIAVSLEPNNQELRKQYTETKALYEKEIVRKTSAASKTSTPKIQKFGTSEMRSNDDMGASSGSSNTQKDAATAAQTRKMDNKGKINGQPLVAANDNDADSKSASIGAEPSKNFLGRPREAASVNVNGDNAKRHQGVDRKNGTKESVLDLASRAASLVAANAGKKLSTPRSAYEFEVSWRALSGDNALQANLLKAIPPQTLPGIFKNALSAPLLVDIVKCTSTFLKEDTELAVSIIENLSKVPRFDMIIMCLSSVDRFDIHRLWRDVFSNQDIPADYAEALLRLRPNYCYGEWQG